MRFVKTVPLAILPLALVALFPLSSSAATYKIHWLLGHKNLDYFEEAALNFKNKIEKETNGDISIDIVLQSNDDPSKGPNLEPEIAGRVAKGEAEMGHSFVDTMGTIDPRLYAFNAPYLFRGYRHMEGVFDGPIGSELLGDMRSHGIVGLSFTYSGGATAVASVDRELRRPEDLKGLKVGVFGDEVEVAWLKSLGAIPVTLKHDLQNIAPLARDRRLDAVVITWRNFEREALNSDFAYVNMMNSAYLVSVTYVNEKFFASLPQKYQTLLLKESQEAGRIERAKTIALNEEARRSMTGKGVRSVYLNEGNLAAFSTALAPVYASAIEPIVGHDLVSRIRKTADSATAPAIPVELARQ